MNRRRVAIMFFLVIISLVFLISSTYAWFSLNTSLESTGISIRVNAVQKLEMSTDAKTWRNSLTLHDILNADYEVPRLNQVPVKFQPVSTIGNINNGFMDMYLGVVSSDKDKSSSTYGNLVLTAKKEEEKDGERGKFLAFDMYFKSDATKPVFLGRNSKVTYENESTGVENTLRIAFVNEGYTDSQDVKTIQSLSTNDKKNVSIWEPNYDSHTDEAIKVAKRIYNIDIKNHDSQKIGYYGIKKEITEPLLLTSKDIDYFEPVTNVMYTNDEYHNKSGENILLFYLNCGITKIRVYAWVEGQDVDCENKAAGSSFIFDMHFTTEASSKEE